MAAIEGNEVVLPRREISLYMRRGPLRGEFFPTSWSELLVIGRAPSSHIVLPHPTVSSTHCLLVRLRPGIRFLLIDARSRQGTLVNGRAIVKQVVAPGDRIGIGAFDLEFTDTVSLQRPSYMARPAAGRPPVFALVPHRPSGLPVALPPSSVTVLGSSRLAHVRVKDRFVSDFHSLIATHPSDDGRAPVLIDLHGDNGTYVKTEAIHRKRLHPNNIITLGKSQLIVRRASALDEPASACPRVTPAVARRAVILARPDARAARRGGHSSA